MDVRNGCNGLDTYYEGEKKKKKDDNETGESRTKRLAFVWLYKASLHRRYARFRYIPE